MKVERFEELICWQKAKDLSVLIYKHFQSINDYSFRNQIQRASVSVMNNIAEGFERKSNNELKQFLYVAKGSCGELRSMLILSKELNIISDYNFKNAIELSEEVSKLISGFIKTL